MSDLCMTDEEIMAEAGALQQVTPTDKGAVLIPKESGNPMWVTKAGPADAIPGIRELPLG